jgi:hypothetical protein
MDIEPKLASESLKPKKFNFAPLTHLRWWKKQNAAAEQLRQERQDSLAADTTLILVGAQHPLRGGTDPGPEFAARLDEACRLYEETVAMGEKVEIYVSGSRHVDEKGQEDLVSLSDAGTTYLSSRGIPIEALHGEDWNERYMPEIGVYSGADEMFVGASAYKDSDQFGEFMLIASPGQVKRAKIYAIANGVHANVLVPEALKGRTDLFHSGRSEKAKEILARVIARTIDPDGQTFLKNKMRSVRVPDDGNIHTVPELQKEYSVFQVPQAQDQGQV